MLNQYNLIEVTTPTCSVCKMLAPMIKKTLDNFSQISLNVYDHEATEVKELIERYSIKSVPAFFFCKNGEVVDNHFGAIAMSELKTKLNKLINEC